MVYIFHIFLSAVGNSVSVWLGHFQLFLNSSAQVPTKMDLLREGFVANGALEWPLTSVQKKVSSQFRLLFEGLVTNGTLNWPLISVHSEMVI